MRKTFGNIPKNVLKKSSNARDYALKNVWNLQMLEKQCFLKNLKAVDLHRFGDNKSQFSRKVYASHFSSQCL